MPPIMASQLVTETDIFESVNFGRRKRHNPRNVAPDNSSDIFGKRNWGNFGKSLGLMFLLPVVGQEFIEIAGGIFSKSLNDVSQIRPRLDAVTSASGEDSEDDSMIFCPLVAAVKQPGMLPHGNVFRVRCDYYRC